jgi:hypothetical protein
LRIDSDAGGDRIIVHRARIRPGREADLADVAARKAVLEQAAHRVAVHRPFGRVAHVEMRIQGDQADAFERESERMRGGPGDRIIPTDQHGQRMRLGAGRRGVPDWCEPVRR